MDSDQAARIYRAEAPRVLAVLTRSFGPNLAEDAAAEPWVRWLERQPDRPGAEAGWLIVTARREAIRAIRSREQPSDHMDVLPDPREGPEEHAVITLTASELLEQLPPAERLVLGLWMQGHGYRQIAERSQRSETWVNRHLTRARERLYGHVAEPGCS